MKLRSWLIPTLTAARTRRNPVTLGKAAHMRQDPSFFEGKEPVLIYIAKKLRDALRLEGIFTQAGVDYGVETDEYRAGVVFRTVRTGAFFYVLPETVAAAHDVMLGNGYKPHVEAPSVPTNT
jgi:hypothetical protein